MRIHRFIIFALLSLVLEGVPFTRIDEVNMKKNIGSVKCDSAQISIDYIVGIGIFIVAITFVFQFMFTIFAPFQSNSDEMTLAADRASTIIVERLIKAEKSGTLNVVDQGKLYQLNNSKLNYSNQTAYNNILSEIGLISREMSYDLNMTVSYTNNGTLLNFSGPALPTHADIAQTKRFVLITNSSTGYNQTAYISVRVW